MAIADDFMLLTLREQDSRPLIGNLQLGCGLAAAVLVELAYSGRIELNEERVGVLNSTPLGIAQEDAALARLVAEQPHDLAWWVGSVRVGLREQILARLVARGVLIEQPGRALRVFRTIDHHLADGGPGRELRARVEALLHDAAADRSAIALLSITYATGLDRVLFPAINPAIVQGRINQLGEDGVAQAVAKTIRRVLMILTAAATTAG